MKKSSIFKILTLFLTFVIFSCCSGCFLSFVAYTNEKKLQEALEIQKEKKLWRMHLFPKLKDILLRQNLILISHGKKDVGNRRGLKRLRIFLEAEACLIV